MDPNQDYTLPELSGANLPQINRGQLGGRPAPPGGTGAPPNSGNRIMASIVRRDGQEVFRMAVRQTNDCLAPATCGSDYLAINKLNRAGIRRRGIMEGQSFVSGPTRLI